MAKIIIVDDDPAMVSVLSEVLREHHHEVLPASSPERALQLVKESAPDLVLSDIEMPEGKPMGLKLLQQVKEHNRSIPVVMITGQGTKERAMQALRAGAQDFVEKPFQIDELVKRIDNALMQQKAVHALEENVELRRQLQDKFRFDSMIGSSPRMEAVYRLIERVANTESTVLILGESGTGKELVARALHYNSRRAAMPFVAVNCSAIPETLLESEIFGHERGAFTGALERRAGCFELANGGTLFLDEIAEMTPATQAKFLRILQDGTVRRLGGKAEMHVDVRVVAATNKDPLKAMKDGTFRKDLYYRLNVFSLPLPPLRERKEDIPLLIQAFLEEFNRKYEKRITSVDEAALQIVLGHAWPGNVRELRNTIERAVIVCEADLIAPRHLPPGVTPATGGEGADMIAFPLGATVEEVEKGLILRTLASVNNNKARAAAILGISVKTLHNKLHRYGA